MYDANSTKADWTTTTSLPCHTSLFSPTTAGLAQFDWEGDLIKLEKIQFR
jgi:hypothetical protein